MIELAEAITLVESHARALPPRRMRLADAVGRVLALPVVSDVDSPPWDRAMMDGFAVRGEDVAAAGDAGVELDVVVDVAAGHVTGIEVLPGSCARIMTGAPVPKGADAVIPIECLLPTDSAGQKAAGGHAGSRVRLRDTKFREGQHVGRLGAAAPGMRLAAAEIGLAAEGGATHVVASPQVRVAILSTGSELVSPEAVPAFGQTRNSNGPMLFAAVKLLGGEPIPMGIAADRPEAIRAAVAQGLAADILVLSGGVSAGDLDLVPGIFARSGIEKIFHKVRLKPGKPVWFGRLERAESSPTLVFGLPGNPASSLVCFELFVRPAMRILAGAGRDAWHLPRVKAVLTGSTKAAADRPVYLPCRLTRSSRGLEAAPLPWTGSSDLLGLAGAGGLLALPAGGKRYEPGEEVEVVLRD
jgi:molybdopterin molybdotransferase